MSLKILIVPLLVIGTLVVAMGYIKPGFTLLSEKQLALQTKQEEMNSLNQVIANIEKLSGQVKAASDQRTFLYGYIPEKSDQERAVDIVNFIGNSAGVFLRDVDITEKAKVAAPIPEPVEETPASAFNALGGSSTPVIVPQKREYDPNVYLATVKGEGSYGSIETFFTQLVETNRLLEIRNFTIEKEESKEGGASKSTLVFELEGSFYYLPPVKVQTALLEEVFQRSSIDVASVDEIVNRVERKIPPIEKPPTGRPNPFE